MCSQFNCSVEDKTMSDDNKGSPPTHDVYAIEPKFDKQGKPEKGFWHRVGSTWPNADSEGFNITFFLKWPDHYTISMRERKDKDPEPEPAKKGYYKK